MPDPYLSTHLPALTHIVRTFHLPRPWWPQLELGAAIAPYLRPRLRHAVERAEALARAKGLDAVFSFELLTLRREFEQAIRTDSALLGDQAFDDAADLMARLTATPSKPLHQPPEEETPVTIGRP